jgi:hypothetical protein
MNPKTSGGTASVPSDIFNVMPSSASSPAIFNPSMIFYKLSLWKESL